MLTETRPALTTSTGQFQDPTYFTQTPRVEYSDEGSLAITSYQDRVIADVVTNSENEWNTCVRFCQPPFCAQGALLCPLLGYSGVPIMNPMASDGANVQRGK